MSNEEQEQLAQPAKVLRSEEVKSPEVHAWKFINLEQEQKHAEQKLRDEIYQKIQQELEPQIAQQTSILKKEAFEEAKQEGYEAGYTEGFETGQTQGLEKAQESVKETLAPKIERLDSLLTEISNPYQFISNQVFEQLTQISTELAKKLVADHFQAKPEILLEIVQKAIAALPNPDAKLTLELNPADIELIGYYYQNQPPANWQMQPNPALEPGNCQVKSLDSIVASNWQEQLAEILSHTQNLAANLVKDSAESSNENLAQPGLVAAPTDSDNKNPLETDNPS